MLSRIVLGCPLTLRLDNEELLDKRQQFSQRTLPLTLTDREKQGQPSMPSTCSLTLLFKGT